MRLRPRNSRPRAGHTPPARGARLRGGRWAMCAVVLAAGSAMATAADRPPVPPLPSGIAAELQELVLDVKPDGQFDYARFRFVAPGIAGADAPDFETRAKDMDFLCQSYAWPYLSDKPQIFDRIVISLSDRATEFGVADPDATQFFEVYRIEDGACIWEEF